MPASFVHASGSVVFTRAPARPPRELSFQQAREESTGAVPFVYDWYVADDVMNLAWSGMAEAEKDLLLDFFINKARGMSAAFTYTDVEGNPYIVRFASPALPEITECGYGRFNVSCSLRIAT